MYDYDLVVDVWSKRKEPKVCTLSLEKRDNDKNRNTFRSTYK